MNIWECEVPGCKSVAMGIGPASGLRYIGWHFESGPVILCPLHHSPDLRYCYLCGEYKPVEQMGEVACLSCEGGQDDAD